MKKVVLVLVLLVSPTLLAQNEIPNIFIRVYDLEGNKIGKGKILSISKSTLQLERRSRTKEFSVSNIGSIKTKRSARNNVLVGAGIGAVTVGIAGAAVSEPNDWVFSFTKAEGAFGEAILGGVAGAGIGGITSLFKDSRTYIINGEPSKLEAFIDSIKNP